MDGQSSGTVARVMSKDDEMDEEQRRLEDSEDGLQHVLANQLVCEKIASYLTLSDMKAASQVNPQFLRAIRGTRRFAKMAVLTITDQNAQKSTLEKTENSWRAVRIDVTDSSGILDDLPRLLQSAQFVCLGAPPGKIKNVWRAEDPRAARLLTTVLNSTPALSHLQIDTHFLYTDLRTVLSSPAVQETLRNLNHLEILKKTHTQYEGQNDTGLFPVGGDEEDLKPFERNFRLLTELPNRLKTFYVTELFPAPWMQDIANESVLRLLRNNTTTMEQLSLHGRVWWLQELGTLTFPVLKSLTAIVNDEEQEETLAEFLENQRSLEELTMELTGSFDESLVPSIQGRCMELKKLDLTIELCIGDVEEWSFLGSMNRLKEFRLKTWGEFENGSSLLAFLPKNQLECLSLEGLWDFRDSSFGFWSVAGGVEPDLAVKTELLQGFRCLRKLSFLGTKDAVNDQLMQWLLKEFVSLEEFQLSDCSTLSDAGITGNTTAEWGRGVSFADLRRLKTLKIVRCGGVTPNGVLASCVNVPSLKSLEYSNPPGQIEESVVLELVAQNPRLERLSLDCLDYAGDLGKLKAKVTMKNPRVELSLAEEDEE